MTEPGLYEAIKARTVSNWIIYTVNFYTDCAQNYVARLDARDICRCTIIHLYNCDPLSVASPNRTPMYPRFAEVLVAKESVIKSSSLANRYWEA